MPVPRTYLHPRLHSTEEGLSGEFFDNPNFSGTPVSTRVDRVLNFDWDSVPPAPGLHGNKISVRWSGAIDFPAAGKYTLSFRGLPRDLKAVDMTGEGSAPKLVGFQRVELGAGEKRRISIEIGPREISHVEKNGTRLLSEGTYTLHVATGQPRYNVQDHPISFALLGSQTLPR
jgi:hypothetical protein